MLWENLREEEFDAAIERSNKVCVVPLGCLEMHGQHLPVGTDTHIAYYVAREAAEIEPVVVFPPVYFGDVLGLYMWKGTIAFSSELLQRMLTELCAEIARNGFKKILLLNVHGGNTGMLSNFLRSTAHEKKDYVVMVRGETQYTPRHLAADIAAGVEFPTLTEEDKRYVCEFVASGKTWGHAGIHETAEELFLAPDHCRMDRMHEVDGVSRHRTGYLAKKGIGINGPGTFWMTDHPDSYGGHHADGANARIGKVLLDRSVALQAEAVRLLKADDRVLQWNEEFNAKW